MKTLLSRGWPGTTTNGGRCAPMGYRKRASPAARVTAKNFRHGPKHLTGRSETPSTTGPTSNCSGISAITAEEVWELCNRKLAEPGMGVRGIIEQSNVRLICTTDDPIDDLRYHKQLREDPSCKVKVLPAWRPDRAMNIEQPFTRTISGSFPRFRGSRSATLIHSVRRSPTGSIISPKMAAARLTTRPTVRFTALPPGRNWTGSLRMRCPENRCLMRMYETIRPNFSSFWVASTPNGAG